MAELKHMFEGKVKHFRMRESSEQFDLEHRQEIDENNALSRENGYSALESESGVHVQ